MESGNDSSSDASFGFFGKKRETPKQAEPKKKKVEKPAQTIAKGPENEIKKDTEDKAGKEAENKIKDTAAKKPEDKAKGPEEKKSMEPTRQAEESKNKDPIDRISPFKKEETTPEQDTGKKPETKQEEHKEQAAQTDGKKDNDSKGLDALISRQNSDATEKESKEAENKTKDATAKIQKDIAKTPEKEKSTEPAKPTEKSNNIEDRISKMQEEEKRFGEDKSSKPETTKEPAETEQHQENEMIQKEPETNTNKGNVLLEYNISSDNVTAKVTILEKPEEYIPLYSVEQPVLHKATHAVLDHVRSQVISMVQLSTSEFIDPKAYKDVKKKFMDKAREIIDELLPESSENEKKILVGILIHEMIGLGDIEILLNDNYLEEIVVNNCEEPVWVYHKKFGWLKTNITYKSEEAIYNNMTAIGRKVGRQITNIHPLMDAHLSTGDRVNATLFPISTKGNTMTIRRFSRSPWTIINMIDPKVKTMSLEIAAILWLSIQYELNILVVGGTASGKTSLLNAILPFIPPNQRIISIEDTREIQLPKYLHWIPFSAREPNPEGQGGVSMLDLLTNSLRMRPDRIIVGEIRRSKEAEVMFEAIRTGHSAYATFHSDTAEQAYKRLTNPPISLPEPLISALHLILVQYRHRRKGIRRSLELAELIPLDDMSNKVNVIYKWNARNDEFEKVGRYIRVINEINLFTGMDETEIERNLKDKETILKWMLDNNIKDVNAVGKVFAEYYKDEKKITALAKSNGKPEEILDPELMKKIREQD